MSSRAVTEEAQDATESEALDATEDRLESVKIEEERQPNSHIELTVTIPARRCAKAWQRALRQAGNKLNVPGFRKGKKVRANLVSKLFTLHAKFSGSYPASIYSPGNTSAQVIHAPICLRVVTTMKVTHRQVPVLACRSLRRCCLSMSANAQLSRKLCRPS